MKASAGQPSRAATDEPDTSVDALSETKKPKKTSRRKKADASDERPGDAPSQDKSKDKSSKGKKKAKKKKSKASAEGAVRVELVLGRFPKQEAAEIEKPPFSLTSSSP